LEKIRSFIAIDVEEKDVIRNISKIQKKLFETGANLKLIKPENIHITLSFLGDISITLIEKIHIELKKIYFTSFNIEVIGIGAYPNLRTIRILWAGIGKGIFELRNLVNQLEPRLRTIGIKQNHRGFNPHLTIARVKTSYKKSEIKNYIKKLNNYKIGSIKAENLRLIKSVLTPQGPIYKVLREVHSKS
jgi:2'-5' RNA ligase